jgi:hypothetical protein
LAVVAEISAQRDLQTAAEAVLVHRGDDGRRHQGRVVGHALSEVGQPVAVAVQQNAGATPSGHEAGDVQA